MENYITTIITLISLLSLNCILVLGNQNEACQACISMMRLICNQEIPIMAADCVKAATLNYHAGIDIPDIVHEYFKNYMFHNIVKGDGLMNPEEYCLDILKKDSVLSSEKIKSMQYKSCRNDLALFPDGPGLVRYAFYNTSTLINPKNTNEKRYLEHISNNIVLKIATIGPINYCQVRYPFDPNQANKTILY